MPAPVGGRGGGVGDQQDVLGLQVRVDEADGVVQELEGLQELPGEVPDVREAGVWGVVVRLEEVVERGAELLEDEAAVACLFCGCVCVGGRWSG